MNGRFNINTAVTFRIDCVLEATFEFMLSEVTKTTSNLCNIFAFDRIMGIKKRIRRRPCEL